MAYEAKTQDDLAKWWVIGTGSVVNRLSEVMDDAPSGPAIYYTTGWTASGSEYYRSQTTANDTCEEKIGAAAWSALAVGAGAGSLNAGEWAYDGGTSRLYVRLTGDVAPNATNQVRAHYAWDGSGAGPAIMTEVVEDLVYVIHLLLWIGDGSSSTTLTSELESVTFVDCYPQVRAAASLTIGDLTVNNGSYGASWQIKYSAATIFYICNGSSAQIKIYGSRLAIIGETRCSFYYASVVDIRDSIFSHSWTGSGTYYVFEFALNVTSLNISYLYISDARYNAFKKEGTITNLRINNAYYAVRLEYAITLSNYAAYNATYDVNNYITSGDYTVAVLNPVVEPSNVIIVSADGVILLQRSVNVYVADQNGAAIADTCIVDMYGSDASNYDTAMWTVGSETTTSGALDEQTITVKKWVAIAATETDYNVFKMVISNAGYETLSLENLTIDSAVDWYLELQPMRSRAIRRGRNVVNFQ